MRTETRKPRNLTAEDEAIKRILAERKASALALKQLREAKRAKNGDRQKARIVKFVAMLAKMDTSLDVFVEALPEDLRVELGARMELLN